MTRHAPKYSVFSIYNNQGTKDLLNILRHAQMVAYAVEIALGD